MIKTNKYIVGMVKECVTEIVKMIDWNKLSVPNFDFCVRPYDDIQDRIRKGGYMDLGECWYGCKNVAKLFDGQRENIVLLFGYYGGNGTAVVEIDFDERKETEDIIKWICDAIYESTREELDADSQTVFEIM